MALGRLRVVAILLGLGAATAISGCSSGGKSNAHADGGGAGGHGGAGGAGGGGGGGSGTNGTAGSGAGGSAGSTDAGSDHPPSDGPADTGPSTPQDQACRAAIQAQCDRLDACGFNTPEQCLALAVTCPDYYFSVASSRTVAGLDACLTALAKATCTDLELGLGYGPGAPCLAGGTRPPGAACVHGSDCQSGGCALGTRSCGTCAALPVATGQSCASARCSPGDFCHRTTQLCTPASTIVYAGAGAPCDLSASPVVGCTGDLHCIASAPGTTAGTCRGPLGSGEACGVTGAICGPTLECNNVTPPAICIPIPPPPNPPCGDAGVCDDTTFCLSDSAGKRCAPRAAVGQSCGGDGGTVAVQCVTNAYCLAPLRVCTVYGNLGDACDDVTQPCGGAYLVCTNGRCATLDTGSCPNVPADAAAD